MKTFIAILALVAVAAADVPRSRTNDKEAQVVSQTADVFPDQYQYSYDTSNGIKAEERGVLVNQGKENEGIEVTGSNSYVNDEGKVISVVYTAGADGYLPQGDHLPVPPPIPELIARSLEYNAAHAAKVVTSVLAG